MDGLLKRMAYGALLIIVSAMLAYISEPGKIKDEELLPGNGNALQTTNIEKNVPADKAQESKKLLAYRKITDE